jgi:hypothetical protein
MQIDFHHGTTYVIARYAGFDHPQAEIIAYCSQYVDDATNSGTLTFDNGAMNHHISSYHNTLDYKNFNELSNHQVWIPFHNHCIACHNQKIHWCKNKLAYDWQSIAKLDWSRADIKK